MQTKRKSNKENTARPYADVFVGENYKYYKAKWDANENALYKGWNWAAFFGGAAWMAYRKMYIESAVVIVLTMTLFYNIDIGATGFGIIYGLIGNGLYYKKYQRTVAKTSGMEPAEIKSILKKHGGTSSVVMVLVLILIVLTIFVSALS